MIRRVVLVIREEVLVRVLGGRCGRVGYSVEANCLFPFVMVIRLIVMHKVVVVNVLKALILVVC